LLPQESDATPGGAHLAHPDHRHQREERTPDGIDVEVEVQQVGQPMDRGHEPRLDDIAHEVH
jgi:hypothetical protein